MNLAIIGAGISGLSLGCFLKANQFPEKQFFIFESSNRCGGVIQTIQEQGYKIETAATLFPYGKAACFQLCEILGLEDKVIQPQNKDRYLYFNNRLQTISKNSFKIIGSLSWGEKFFLLKNFFMIRQKNAKNENLKEFFTRHFGREIFDKIIEPLLAGIYAGNPQKLSLAACFPQLKKLEQKYTSVLRGIILEKKQNLQFSSFQNGMQQLTDSMGNYLASNIVYSTKLEKISFQKKKIFCHFLYNSSTRKILAFDKVVLSIPAFAAAEVLKNTSAFPELQKINSTSLVVCALGYQREKVQSFFPKGLGFLVPAIVSKDLLGGFFNSNIFPYYRSKKEDFLVQLMLGGERNKEIVEVSDSQILQKAKDSLKNIFQITTNFNYSKIIRWKKAIPQYNLGHLAILDNLKKFQKKYSVCFHSNSYNGIGLIHCIENSCKIAQNILKLDTKDEKKV